MRHRSPRARARASFSVPLRFPSPSCRFWHSTFRTRETYRRSRRDLFEIRGFGPISLPRAASPRVAPGSRIALSHGIRYPAPYRRCLSLARISILCRSLGRTADTCHNFSKMDSNRSRVVFEPRDPNRPDDPRTPVTDRVWRRDDSLGG